MPELKLPKNRQKFLFVLMDSSNTDSTKFRIKNYQFGILEKVTASAYQWIQFHKSQKYYLYYGNFWHDASGHLTAKLWYCFLVVSKVFHGQLRTYLEFMIKPPITCVTSRHGRIYWRSSEGTPKFYALTLSLSYVNFATNVWIRLLKHLK